MHDHLQRFEAYVDVLAQTKIEVYAYDKSEAKELIDNYLHDNKVDTTSHAFEVVEQSVHEDNIYEEDVFHSIEAVNPGRIFE